MVWQYLICSEKIICKKMIILRCVNTMIWCDICLLTKITFDNVWYLRLDNIWQCMIMIFSPWQYLAMYDNDICSVVLVFNSGIPWGLRCQLASTLHQQSVSLSSSRFFSVANLFPRKINESDMSKYQGIWQPESKRSRHQAICDRWVIYQFS